MLGRFDVEVPHYGVPEAEAIGSALRRSARDLDALVRREREFAVSASHELRTPVTALRLEIEDVASWPQTPPDVAEELSRALAELDRLSATISTLLGGPTAVTTVHHGHAPEIELTSDDTARGIWAMEDKLWWTNGDHEEHLHGYGHYHEEYRKVDGRWLISYRKLTRLREDVSEGFFDYLQAL